MTQLGVTVGIIGFGKIGERLARLLAGDGTGPRLTAILARPAALDRANDINDATLATSSLDAFIARKPNVAVECASPATLVESAPRLLAAGIDVIPLSLTAFTDHDSEALLATSAAEGPGRIEIPPGAIGTLDLLATARNAGLTRVVYRQCKSIEMWKHTPAAGLADLSAIASRSAFMRGSVREIAARFPNNLNVSVGVALAGLGLDRTEIELIADPDARETSHELDIEAPPGTARLRLGGREVMPDGDPVDYSTFSLIRLLRRRQARILL
jgi:aspartate dehydrogenase